jgi:putative oxidoreductase
MIVRRLARPLLASYFIAGGVDTLRNPAAKVSSASAAPVAPALAAKLPRSVASDPEQYLKADAGVKILSGLLLATNRAPRLSAAVLAASLVPSTAMAHRFWEEKDRGAMRDQQQHFFANVSLVGGLLIAAVDTGGKPSLGWRARRASTFAKAKAVDSLPLG